MGALKLTTASSGSVILNPANTASDVTITVPALTATMAVDGPAFSAYASGNLSLSASTWTKIQLNTEVFDTNNNFDSSTNYRFTPTVAGYYQINGQASFGATTTYPNNVVVAIYKNGSIYCRSQISITSGQVNPQLLTSSVISMNGSTDYLELYVWASGGSGPQIDGGSTLTTMSGSMVRSA